MTNLSDLFPAGAGKQVGFVADGAISAAGKPVILNGALPINGSLTLSCVAFRSCLYVGMINRYLQILLKRSFHLL